MNRKVILLSFLFCDNFTNFIVSCYCNYHSDVTNNGFDLLRNNEKCVCAPCEDLTGMEDKASIIKFNVSPTNVKTTLKLLMFKFFILRYCNI